ncbi:type II secretion system protein GspE [Candidatus Dojkabacteria bacterium CG_4_9_14_3_um_filter_150_Dojkabacteria_WS6_41_13]|uniref:Type II secretion system protein GspE n=1 Tax=Candidatus Dojkabacteria bacterium CG_4_10_14_0_2_um_filter_Dojkabacteria_WS6_41_15 TaxID=2014249 RepID=A0A2M7W258_9BACT|nr:MAG: type II secretion system protein GspE [Candidatus Dojkabacteria bacterium CG_4_10_14_3_um_filter_Dojkabacteria_WS6_41_9]PJA14368.1 MAG: type II secretion system protein GspE [Candidatus Dojkabacteria bacterium CG_4_10_14_0_2_um_filter_Dojkabacteria_WS6_41_15]PJB22763.1 MAG: type II secretion system protein GspE [Candidatus Dojkabacteria bacterium CG_4_9_14_3_um_filter_150_Dojkabacteria_WS6_41_13]
MPEESTVKPDQNATSPATTAVDTQDIGNLLEILITKAYEAKSSDIHIEPTEKKLVVRYRIDGLLREAFFFDKLLEEALLFKIKVEAQIRTDEHFAPQDGKIRFNIDGTPIDARISIVPTTKGEKVVIRLLVQQGKGLTLEELGIVGTDLEKVNKSYTKPYGMILAVGPTGSGKTTTLYTILKILNLRERNITTIEDPVEYDIDGVNHIQVNTKADMTFANGLRAILRQDPDIVMVGEIRDTETARIAINAAMTGHLVLSTLHTNDAVTTIPRLVDMGIENYLVASTVNVIIAQRLTRRLCEKCKQKYKLSKTELEHLQKMRPDIADFFKEDEALFKKNGCETCSNTGYKGRVGLYEVLELTEKIRRLISEKATVDDIFALARKLGLKLIVESGSEKIKAGMIDFDELMRVSTIRE